ncbi:hypothetical protein BX600DRAFT_506420 [Xylariales sp. PMI_506]|nr:hypothetical protein BX600DRAFT_506420 [Xylariales sp. PMI_506]
MSDPADEPGRGPVSLSEETTNHSEVVFDNSSSASLTEAEITASVRKQEIVPTIDAPVTQRDLVGGIAIFPATWLEEMRKAIREEVNESIQRIQEITELPPGRSSVNPSVAGSTTSSVEATSSSAHALVSAANLEDSPPASQKPGVRFSDRRHFSKRPAGVSRHSSSSLPLVEWGLLFDSDGTATGRLGQVIEGLAEYIIYEYSPKKSVAIPPEKLGKFYSKYRLEKESYPFCTVFDAAQGDSLADLYLTLGCQFHLIQKDSCSIPSVPALTPDGFVRFLTLCIVAYPDEEFRRWERLVADIPLSTNSDPAAVGVQREDLPRTIIRSYFPAKPDVKNKKLLDTSMKILLPSMRRPGLDSMLSTSSPVAAVQQTATAALLQLPPHQRYKPSPKSRSTTEEDTILVNEYVPRSNRRRFTPTTLQTIGDESAVKDYDDPRERHQNGGMPFMSSSQDSPVEGGGVKLRPSHRSGGGGSERISPTEYQFSPDHRWPQRQQPRSFSFSSRPSSYEDSSYSPNSSPPPERGNVDTATNHILIPPPPVGSRRQSSPIPLAPPPLPPSSSQTGTSHLSASAPSIGGIEPTSSSSLVHAGSRLSVSHPGSRTLVAAAQTQAQGYGPVDTSFSTFSIGPEHRQPLDRLGYDRSIMFPLSSLSTLRAGPLTISEIAKEGGGRSSGSHRKKSSHRRRGSSVAPAASDEEGGDERGLTWGEFFEAQKGGQGQPAESAKPVPPSPGGYYYFDD